MLNKTQRKRKQDQSFKVQKLCKNYNSQFIDETLNQQNYQEWLTQEDIANIARIKHGWYGKNSNVIFEVIGSVDQLGIQLDRYKGRLKTSNKQSLTLIVSLNNLHWVTLVITYENQRFFAYYIDSLGEKIEDHIHDKCSEKITQINIQSFNIKQQNDHYNCGIFALENAKIINDMIQSGQINQIEQKLKDYKPTRGDLEDKRKEFAEALQQQKVEPDYEWNMRDNSNSEISIPTKIKKTKTVKTLHNEREMLNNKTQLSSQEYSKSGLTHTLHGNIYQLKLLMLFVKRGLDKGYIFKLATEMDAAEKFDDLVFQYIEGDKKLYRFLQAKHKQDDNKKITINDLLTEKDSEFSLQKYFISYCKIKQKLEFKGSELKDFIICTNIGLEKNLRKSFELVEGEDTILNFKSKECECLRLKLDQFPNKRELISRLKNTSELSRLAKKLAEYVLEGRPLDLKDDCAP